MDFCFWQYLRLDICINPTNTKYIKGRMLDYFRKQTLKGIVEEHVFTIKIYETKEECLHEQNLQGEKNCITISAKTGDIRII